VEDFKIEVKAAEQKPEVIIIKIDGELDVHTVPEMDQTVKEQFEKNVNKMVFDLSGLTYSSSAGIGIIMSSIKFARGKGGDIKLSNLQPRVHRVLELLGFTKIFEIYDTESAALEAF
jgi:anti-anti-sigma factor